MTDDTTPAETALHLAANAMQTVRRIDEYRANPPPNGKFGVNIEWTWGRDANPEAYRALRAEVTQMVEEQMDTMLRRAIDTHYAIAKSRKDAAKRYLL